MDALVEAVGIFAPRAEIHNGQMEVGHCPKIEAVTVVEGGHIIHQTGQIFLDVVIQADKAEVGNVGVKPL